MKYSSPVAFLGICLLLVACGPATPAVTPTPSAVATEAPFSPHPELEPIGAENVTRLDAVDRWGKGDVYGAAYSPDGSRIAVSTATGVYLYDSQTMQEQGFINLPIAPRDRWYPSAGVAFSPDGSQIAVAGHEIQFWNLSTNETESMFSRTPGFDPVQIAFSPDGASLAVMSMGGYAPCDAWGGNYALYRLRDRRLLYSQNFCPESSMFYFHFGENGRVYFVGPVVDGDPGPAVSVLDSATGQLLDQIHSSYDNMVIDISPDGSRLAIGDFSQSESQTRIVDAVTRQTLTTISGTAAFLPDPDKLLVKRGDGPWEVMENGNPVCAFTDQTTRLDLGLGVYRSIFGYSPDGRFLIQESPWGGSVEIWDLNDCRLFNTIPFPGGDQRPAFSPDGRLFAVDSSTGISVLDTATAQYRYTLPRDTVWSSWPSFLFSPDSSCIATYPNEDALVLWNAVNGTRLRTIPLVAEPEDYALGSDCRTLAVTDRAGLNLLDLESSTPQPRLVPVTGEAGSVFWSPDGSMVAVESKTHTQLGFYDPGSGDLLRQIDLGEAGGVVAFSPDWRTFVTTSDGYLFLWDVGQGIVLRRFNGHHVIGDRYSSLSGLLFSPDGKILISLGSYDDTVRFWDVESGLLVGELIPPFHTRQIALSPDGRLLATTGDDGTMRIWGIRP